MEHPKHWHILIIDDNPDDRAEFRKLLITGSGRTCRFTEAAIGATGLQMVLDNRAQSLSGTAVPFDCVLLDFNLPDQNGTQWLTTLCGASSMPPCPVVVMTGWDGVDDSAGPNVLQAGAQDYIGKSWTTAPSLCRAIENSIDRFKLVAVIFNNITERRNVERKLQEQAQALTDQDRRKDEFLAMLSHELRNPLAPLTNALHMLRLQANEDPLQQQARRIIERQVGQLNHLVGELLEIARISTGRVLLRLERIALSGVLDHAIETAQPLIEERRHVLEVCAPPHPVWLQADASRLEQVVVNLLTNAAKYTDPGGRIWLSVTQEGQEAVLRVRDTGIGIAADLLPRIFDLFTQAEKSLERSQGGLGIGLCLVQRLVELHGGNVVVTSVVGQGSEFVVRLPVTSLNLKPLLPPQAEVVRPADKCCCVLVVDDNVDAAESMGALLAMQGHEVRVVHDGAAALEAVQSFPVDVVLLDIGLPGLTGLEVAQRIRQLPALKDLVLVALTGYGQDSDRERTREAGFDHHLVKPADFDAVLKILETVPSMTA
ncbi:response regulator [Actimicrobium sp. CCI2.3]|uniref:response regulator n=1 Tax=Actimicrobium sp. CCI2.3 TaxID=3048616 RepID=UPI002AB5685E|nr:response regulator [Actimicrobium sp. CCI2.3]MDY7576680.1 response regulator [Actimicrobium sp. CCI2.3]MEB0023554.1 response regulator [Actimicrobium sp. CCI2.3]